MMFISVLTLDDNPAFDGLYEFCSISAGGSIGTSSIPNMHALRN
jgi:hypothetical protein